MTKTMDSDACKNKLCTLVYTLSHKYSIGILYVQFTVIYNTDAPVNFGLFQILIILYIELES
jgi:hypothetical protein